MKHEFVQGVPGTSLIGQTSTVTCLLFSCRSLGLGYLQVTSRVGAALSPWVVKWLKIVNIILPFSLMGGSAIICSILLLWLPETANKKTAETLEDQFDNTDCCKDIESKLAVRYPGYQTLLNESDTKGTGAAG